MLLSFLAVSACATLDTSDSQQEADTSWLIRNLEQQGIAIEGRGVAKLDLEATSSTRMVLNRVDIVDVYEFETVSLAQENAQILQGSDAGRDVYQLDGLVVVHHSRPGSGVKPVLNGLLSQTL